MLIALGFLLQAVTVSGCPDLSGRYRIDGEDGYVTVVIAQTRCERVTIEWNIRSYPDTAFSRHAFQLDGQLRPDTGWFGSHNTQRTSATFAADTIVLVGAASAAGAAPGFVKAAFYTLNGGICTRFQHGQNPGAAVFAYRVVPGAPFPTEDERDKLQAQCGGARREANLAWLATSGPLLLASAWLSGPLLRFGLPSPEIP